jgi:hypothetical protein
MWQPEQAADAAQDARSYTTRRGMITVTGRMEQIDASIARYLRALDQADREESNIAEANSVRLKEKIAVQALKVMKQTVRDAPDRRVSLTDPDARSMATSGKGTATVGYNVQIAVDAEHHLIVAHEVTNRGKTATSLRPWRSRHSRPRAASRSPPGRPRLLQQ